MAKQERKPYLTVYDDGTVDVEVYQGHTETFDVTSPVGFNLHWVDNWQDPARFQEITDPYAMIKAHMYLREGWVRFDVRERPKPPPPRPEPPYNTVDLHELGASFDGVQRYERKPA
jgi:hypothetical protein